ncbi:MULTISPECIES: protein phosphatase 2C domain-containing protein [Streptomyces]|uniref:Protein phosphatase 2C domain-containing protein n=1 Tax=Streptomyces ramulosus TaxID=47762 RepID=A0ABW1FS92_9ACTN
MLPESLEAASEPRAEADGESTAEPRPEPVTEPVFPEPLEAALEPRAEADGESTAEPRPEPVTEPVLPEPLEAAPALRPEPDGDSTSASHPGPVTEPGLPEPPEATPAPHLEPDEKLTPAPQPAPVTAPAPTTAPAPAPAPGFIGHRPPTYAAEPVALPVADPAALGELVPDTVLDGAQYGSLTLRAVSQRGDSARYRGAPRRDALLLARFGSGAQTLILAAVASGPAAGDPRAAHDACAWIGGAVARSCTRLAEDLRTDHRSALRSGLQRLAGRGYGKLRGRTAGPGEASESPAAVRCLLLPADPACRTRVFFGVGEGGFLRLRDGVWEDLEPSAAGPVTDAPGADPDGAGQPAPFLFGTVTGRRGDALLLCSAGLAEPLADEPGLADRLATDFSGPPPGLTSFLTSAQVRVKGHARDRTAVGVWDT